MTCNSQPKPCDQRCHDLPNTRGVICACYPGYRFNKQTSTCEDIDECQNSTLNYCSQVCINIKGSYQCECASGFEPSAVNRSDCHAQSTVQYLQ